MGQIKSRPLTERLIRIEQKDLDEFAKDFDDELEKLREAAIKYHEEEIKPSNITEEVKHNFIDARSRVKDTIEFTRFFNIKIQEQQRHAIEKISQIQNNNRITEEEYKQVRTNTRQEVDENLASFPLKSQTELRKTIIYLYIVLQVLGVLIAIMVLYIQTQSKPSKKIKPKAIQRRAQNQLANTYSTGLGFTNQFGNTLLDYANRGTSYGIRQGQYATDGLARVMFGNQARK